MRIMTWIFSLLFVGVMLAGCGETIRGVGRDMSRIGTGIKTIFVSK